MRCISLTPGIQLRELYLGRHIHHFDVGHFFQFNAFNRLQILRFTADPEPDPQPSWTLFSALPTAPLLPAIAHLSELQILEVYFTRENLLHLMHMVSVLDNLMLLVCHYRRLTTAVWAKQLIKQELERFRPRFVPLTLRNCDVT